MIEGVNNGPSFSDDEEDQKEQSSHKGPYAVKGESLNSFHADALGYKGWTPDDGCQEQYDDAFNVILPHIGWF